MDTPPDDRDLIIAEFSRRFPLQYENTILALQNQQLAAELTARDTPHSRAPAPETEVVEEDAS